MLDQRNTPHLKSILLVTQYFPPEIGGGAQRSSGIAEGLQKCGIDVTVIAPFPTYLMRDHERATSWKFWEEQRLSNIRIIRSFVIAPDRVHILKRILYYVTFAISSFFNGVFHVRKVDAIIVISPPLLTGITGVFLKKIKKSKLVFDIGDIWPESAIQLGFIKNNTLIRFLEWLECWIYKHSDAVNLVTKKTFTHFLEKHPNIKNTNYIPNFVDILSIKKIERNKDFVREFGLEDKIVFGYAGNIGSAQGILIIVEAALKLKHREDIVFLIVGDGIDLFKIIKSIKDYQLKNVIYVPPVKKEEINQYISLFHYSIIPLVKSELFNITIPSKLYECMAAEIPVLLCVDGEARQILEEADAGYFVEPENSNMLAEKIIQAANNPADGVRMGRNGREYVQKHYNRDEIVKNLLGKLKAIKL